MPPPEHSTNLEARVGRWSVGGLSTEHVAHGIKTTPGVVSAAAFAMVASRPWTRSGSAADPPPSSFKLTA
jgi:hypothetical protein